jgi:hypothetical protein
VGNRSIRILVAALTALAIMSTLAWRRAAARRELAEYVGSGNNEIDFGVELRVVKQDLEKGQSLLDDAPPLVILRTHYFGGMVKVGRKPQFTGPSRNPVILYCSEDAEPIILHGDELPDRLLLYGSEGAGKTRVLALWILLRSLEATGSGHIIGATSPTGPRSEEIKEAIEELWSPDWYTWNERKRTFRLRNGVRVTVVSTHQPSKKTGSRVQGFNWRCAASDEIQDSLEKDADIEMRGRKAPFGRYKRLCTATSKDFPEFRRWRDGVLAAVNDNDEPLWAKRVLLGLRSPFQWLKFWDDKKFVLTNREYRRRILCEDLPSEKRVYDTWSPEENLRPIPQIGAEDVTVAELAPWGDNLGMLIGHDPGRRKHVSIFLRAYQIGGRALPVWFVVDEVTTKGTLEKHIYEVRERLKKHYVQLVDREGRPRGKQAFVRADPYSTTGAGDEKPSREFYTLWRNAGFRIQPAAFTRQGTSPGNINKEARIEMVCTLLCNEAGERRLYVACNDNKQPVAPELVTSFETAERDEANKAETEKKDDRDRSHWPAGLGYGLWAIEKPRNRAEAARG